MLEASGLPFDWLVISAVVGLEKPSAAFFVHLCELSGLPPERIAYVGDRADNDVAPAAAAGMVPIHVRRGPWAVIHAGRPELALAALSVGSLAELPGPAGRAGRLRPEPVSAGPARSRGPATTDRGRRRSGGAGA